MKRSTAENYPVSLLFVVRKVFEKLVNNRPVDHLEKCGLFSDLKQGFSSFGSTSYLLTVKSHRISRALNMSGATRAVAFDIFKAFTRCGILFFLKNSNLLEFQFVKLALYCLFSVIDDFL